MIRILPSGQLVRARVAETESTVVVIQEREQFRRGVEAREIFVRLAAGLKILDLAGSCR